MKTLIITMILLLAAQVSADTIQCDNGRPGIGSSIGETLLKCGQPYAKDRRIYTETIGEYSKTVYIDTFVYDALACHYVLTFTDGEMTKIERP